MNKEEPEYTEVYTFKEKLPLMGKILIGGLLFASVYHYYLFPIQKEYLDTMYCRVDFVFELKLFFHVLFLIPVLCSLYFINVSRKIIKLKRFPLSDKSDFKRKILRGNKAVNRGKLLIGLSVFLLVLSIYLDIRVNKEMISKIDIDKIDKSDCPVIKK